MVGGSKDGWWEEKYATISFFEEELKNGYSEKPIAGDPMSPIVLATAFRQRAGPFSQENTGDCSFSSWFSLFFRDKPLDSCANPLIRSG